VSKISCTGAMSEREYSRQTIPSKKNSTPKTQQCQKCYQVGHWTYQCKGTPVYQHRPSRSLIMKNTTLTPGLHFEMPPKLQRLEDKIKGIADIQKKKHSKRRKIESSSDDSSDSSSNSSSKSDSDSSSNESDSSTNSSDTPSNERKKQKKEPS